MIGLPLSLPNADWSTNFIKALAQADTLWLHYYHKETAEIQSTIIDLGSMVLL